MSTMRTAIARYQKLGLAVILFGIGGAAAATAMCNIAGAVVTSAIVAVESNLKKVQHPDGGLIVKVAARNGDRVREGDVLVKLDSTELNANLQILSGQIAELTARADRLRVEGQGADGMDVGDDPETAAIRGAQAKLLKARQDLRDGKKQQFMERISQLEEEITGFLAQIDSKDRQIELVRKELASLEDLRQARLVTESRVMSLQRDAARLDGERGQLLADIARTKVQVGETKLQLIGIDQAFQSEVLSELRDAEAKIHETLEKVASIRARMGRLEIRAPSSGVVHKLTATTIGGVIGAGEVIGEIVPDDGLVIEGHVDPGLIDRVHVDQKTIVRFPSLDHRSTPEIAGVVKMISPDVKQDTTSGAPYYLILVNLAPTARTNLGDHTLRPGMPAELQIQTGQRSVLSFLMKPLIDQMARAMREG